MEIGKPFDLQIPVTVQNNKKITNESDPSKLVALDCADILISSEMVSPLMNRVISFCKINKFVPDDIKKSAIKYMRIEFAFVQKWGLSDNADNIYFDARLIWRFFNKEKYKYYKKNFDGEEAKMYIARKELLTKFADWGKKYLESKAVDLSDKVPDDNCNYEWNFWERKSVNTKELKDLLNNIKKYQVYLLPDRKFSSSNLN